MRYHMYVPTNQRCRYSTKNNLCIQTTIEPQSFKNNRAVYKPTKCKQAEF